MGKNKGHKAKKGEKYVHAHNPNPEARESGERRLQMHNNLEIKRLKQAVERKEEEMHSWLPVHARVKQKEDPQYNLKGAARAAREFYPDPKRKPDVPPQDLFETYDGRLWEHEEGRELFSLMCKLAVSQHNLNNYTRDATKTFEQLLALAPDDVCQPSYVVPPYLFILIYS